MKILKYLPQSLKMWIKRIQTSKNPIQCLIREYYIYEINVLSSCLISVCLNNYWFFRKENIYFPPSGWLIFHVSFKYNFPIKILSTKVVMWNSIYQVFTNAFLFTNAVYCLGITKFKTEKSCISLSTN